MSEIKQFRLPDPGEGLTEAEIVSWKVSPGDTVRVNDVIVEIETAKALVELPSPFAGVVTDLLVPEGATVDVGTPIIAVDVAPTGSGGAAGPVATHGPRTPVLVGYGARQGASVRRRRRAAAPVGAAEDPRVHVLAKPPVRKLARDLGVDLGALTASAPNGVISRADVEEAAGRPGRGAADERVTRIPIRGVRKLTAEAMVASAFTAPHVTEWVQVDVTASMKLVRRLREDPEFGDVRVSVLLLVARALLLAVRRNPGINATWDGAAGEILVRHYVNLGIAAATPRGLLVPNVKDAERLSTLELARSLTALTADARQGRTPAADLAGGTITITNVGVFGVDGGTPILNVGEAAILALGQVREQAWVHRGKVRPRWVATLALSFDHRVVDGDLGSRALADVAAVLTDPGRALVWA